MYQQQPGYGGGPPQQWHPGMGGPPAQDFRMGQGPPTDNPNMAHPPAFGPPPMQGMPTFGGYERVGGFGQMAPMPPPPPPPPPQGDPPPMAFSDIANLDEAACRQAMIEFVAENCCYGDDCAKEMTIENINGLSALHYTLETFTETRSTGYAHEPYRGGMIDGPENGPPPPPWAINCVADGLFQGQTKKVEVPHTASVIPCHACRGNGWQICQRCQGWGQVTCHSCDGSGHRLVHDPETGQRHEMCFSCGGDGKRSCGTCGGDGRVTCSECDGYRNLKCYIMLTVKFINHKEDHIIEKTDMPDHLVRQVQGTIIFEQVLPQVWPIAVYPVAEINQNSMRLVQKHRSAFPTERSLMQRQQLRAVPVTEVSYRWKETAARYWVYGKERKVHSPDYPQQCSCTIL